MHDERLADSIDGVFYLNCTVVNCSTNVGVFWVKYQHDRLGNILPLNIQGPYIRFWGRTGGDEKVFTEGSLHFQRSIAGYIIIEPYALVPIQNEYSLGCPLKPFFGFRIDQVFWLCPAHAALYRDDPKTLKDIVAEAAEDEILKVNRFLF